MSNYSSGIIAIPRVTGDITITATAVATASPNIITESFQCDGVTYSARGTIADMRVSSSGGGNSSTPGGTALKGSIPLTSVGNTVLKITGQGLPTLYPHVVGNELAWYTTIFNEWNNSVGYYAGKHLAITSGGEDGISISQDLTTTRNIITVTIPQSLYGLGVRSIRFSVFHQPASDISCNVYYG